MVTVQGEEQVQSTLNRFVRFENEISKMMPEFSSSLESYYRNLPYPSIPPNSRYIRTFDLKGSYDAKKTGKTQVTLINDANARGRYYAGFVIQEKTQARTHKGRWWTAEEKAKKPIDDFNESVGQEAIAIWESG